MPAIASPAVWLSARRDSASHLSNSVTLGSQTSPIVIDRLSNLYFGPQKLLAAAGVSTVSQLFSKLKLVVQNAQFRLWQRRHPGATFKDYFATLVRDGVQKGRLHPTLGENLRDGNFGEFGLATFERFRKCGLNPDDVCVDYGCGTLRVGVHAIRFLAPGRYWGLDIDQCLLDAGTRLIGSELMAQKRPQLAIISPTGVKHAAEAKPALLFSVAVLIHVHPDELEEYFENILTIVGRSGKGIITGKWSEDATFQYSRQSWAHSLPLMKDLMDRLGGRLDVLKEEDRSITKGKIKGGMLELRSKAFARSP